MQRQQLFKLVCQQQSSLKSAQQRNFTKWFSAYKSAGNVQQQLSSSRSSPLPFQQQNKNLYSSLSTHEKSSDPTDHVDYVPNPAAHESTDQSGAPKPIMTEAEVENHYMNNHIPLSHASIRKYGAPYTDLTPLDAMEANRHREPKDNVDKVAYGIMRFLRVFVHAFFGNKYIHHAVVLETVAAVPGMVAGCLRHFTSLRTMSRDHGWIGTLVEEAENERMHLLTWMQVVKPTLIQRLLVIAAQIVYTTFYTVAYVISPRFCHRMVGYLEEEAVLAYTQFLEAIDRGDIPDTPAPGIAVKYWNLSPEATLRDVVLAVRADECMHRDYNHVLATKAKAGVH